MEINESENSNGLKPFLREVFEVKDNDYLQNLYDRFSGSEKPTRMMLSIINSILHHRLTWFLIDVNLTENFYVNDQNFLLSEIPNTDPSRNWRKESVFASL